MPLLCGDWPVSSAAREGEQVGAAQQARRMSTPSSASCCKFGVGTPYP